MCPRGCRPTQDRVFGRVMVTLTGKIVFSLMINKVRKHSKSRWSNLRSPAELAQHGDWGAKGQERHVEPSPPQAGHSLAWQLGPGESPHVYVETAAELGEAPFFPGDSVWPLDF